MRVRFQNKAYQLVITDHARARMALRNIDEESIADIIENGEVKEKHMKNKFWVFKKMRLDKNSYCCCSISLETPNLVVITALLNWRPEL